MTFNCESTNSSTRTLDLFENKQLSRALIRGNKLEDVKLPEGENLKELNVVDSPCTHNIDVTKCKGLKHLDVGSTSMKNLDISNNYKLKFLNIRDTNIKKIDTSNNPELREENIVHDKHQKIKNLASDIEDISTQSNKSFLKNIFTLGR